MKKNSIIILAYFKNLLSEFPFIIFFFPVKFIHYVTRERKKFFLLKILYIQIKIRKFFLYLPILNLEIESFF